MSDVDTTDKITPEDVTDNPEPDEPDNEPDAWTPPDKDTWTKLESKAKRREEKLREAQAELAKLRGDKDKPDEPDPIAVANDRLVRAETRSVLATAGITDKKDQAAILNVLRLDGVEVDDSGEVDTDELETRVSELRRIFGGSAPDKPRVPRVHTRDKGGPTADPADPDAARFRRFLTGGRAL